MDQKILVSHESPISILDQSRGYNDYDYCLVHLLETHPAYKQFFLDSKKYSREMLLDNSIFELGTAFDSKKFAEYVTEMQPNYYIVPDVLEKATETAVSFSNFVKTYPDLPGLKIGVVQGTSFDELVKCYRYMSEVADYIAISFDYSYYVHTGLGNTKLERWCSGRQRFINDLIQEGVWCWNKPHHLLGCSLAKEFRYYVDNEITNIRSCDTSNPVVAGIHGLRYNGDLGLNVKPSVKLADLIDYKVSDVQMLDITYNTDKFKTILRR